MEFQNSPHFADVVYVQHKMLEFGEDLRRVMLKENGQLYVCGYAFVSHFHRPVAFKNYQQQNNSKRGFLKHEI